MSAAASSGWSVPRRMPANSTCWKQPAWRAAVGDSSASGSGPKTTSAAGLEAYETTMGRSPSPEPPEKPP